VRTGITGKPPTPRRRNRITHQTLRLAEGAVTRTLTRAARLHRGGDAQGAVGMCRVSLRVVLPTAPKQQAEAKECCT
jgi:hypothetical protein